MTVINHSYLDWLGEAMQNYGCRLHAYVLMTNHVHLLLTPEQPSSIAQTLQSLGRRYVRYINGVYRRTGTLWEGRFKSSVVQNDRYLLTCYRYIEMNPVTIFWVRVKTSWPNGKYFLTPDIFVFTLTPNINPLKLIDPKGEAPMCPPGQRAVPLKNYEDEFPKYFSCQSYPTPSPFMEENDCKIICFLPIPPTTEAAEYGATEAAEKLAGDFGKALVKRGFVIYGVYDTAICWKKCEDTCN